MVKNLGGEQLYGKNLLVPLRELIQNSCDAVKARRILEGESQNWGNVTVRTGADEFGNYLEVEDNGVGMSANVLTGPFLDFGASFWGTHLMHEEFPGLESKGFTSTGQYGVGFFSIFMWGEKVNVTTRRFEDSRQSTKVLVFEKGLADRPLLREATESEYIKDGGTRIRIYFSSKESYRKIFEESYGEKLELNQVIEDLCPTVEVTISTEDKNTAKYNVAVEANDWKSIDGIKFVQRALGHKIFKKLHEEDRDSLVRLAKNIRNIDDSGSIIARGFLSNIERYKKRRDSASVAGTVTVGGFRTSRTLKNGLH